MARFFGLIASIGSILGCGGGSPGSAESGPVLKVAVFVDGRLSLNGEESSLDDLKTALQQISEESGTVWYYREQPASGEPPAIVEDVLKAVIESKVPIRLSSKPDYSDSIGP